MMMMMVELLFAWPALKPDDYRMRNGQPVSLNLKDGDENEEFARLLGGRRTDTVNYRDA